MQVKEGIEEVWNPDLEILCCNSCRSSGTRLWMQLRVRVMVVEAAVAAVLEEVVGGGSGRARTGPL